MKNLAITMSVNMGEGVDPLDLYPQLKADILAAPLVKNVEGEASVTHVTQVSAAGFATEPDGATSFVLNCAVEDEFDFLSSLEALRAAIASGLGVAADYTVFASAEESDLPD
jgi:hypothetical protein